MANENRCNMESQICDMGVVAFSKPKPLHIAVQATVDGRRHSSDIPYFFPMIGSKQGPENKDTTDNSQQGQL